MVIFTIKMGPPIAIGNVFNLPKGSLEIPNRMFFFGNIPKKYAIWNFYASLCLPSTKLLLASIVKMKSQRSSAYFSSQDAIDTGSSQVCHVKKTPRPSELGWPSTKQNLLALSGALMFILVYYICTQKAGTFPNFSDSKVLKTPIIGYIFVILDLFTFTFTRHRAHFIIS